VVSLNWSFNSRHVIPNVFLSLCTAAHIFVRWTIVEHIGEHLQVAARRCGRRNHKLVDKIRLAGKAFNGLAKNRRFNSSPRLLV
jgi:hypothetical protein